MEISDEVWEIAQDLYNDADIDVNQNGQVEDASFMDFDEYNNYYRDCNEADFNKAVEYLNSLLNDEVKFYTDDTRYLELSDNHTLWSINIPEGAEFNDEDYSFMYNTALEHLQDEIGVEVFGLGRSGRHICVEDNFRNLTQLDKFKEAQDKWEDWLIETVENSFKGDTVEEAKELAPDEKVAKCLSCGMKVKYRNRDVKHDAMGDYIECPNCKSTFDVDYDNTPTKKTEAEDYSAFTPTNKVLSGNKGLSEKAINEMRWSLPDLFKDMTDEQKQIWEELSLRGMVMSCLIYGEDIHTSTNINAVSKYYKQPYVNEYYDTLGKEVTEEIIKQQTDYFNKGKVIQDVGTDSDGLSYNSFVEPEEESKKVTEATLSKFQTLTVDKDGNEMLLKDTSYNHACSWLEKELAKVGSKVVDTETKGNKTIIKADNKTKFEYDEDKGTLKRLEEAKVNADALKISVAKKLADDMIKAMGNDVTGMDKETYYKNTLAKLNDPKYIDSEIKNYECDNSNRSNTMVKDLNALKKALTEDVTIEQLPSSMLKDKIIKIAKSNGLTVDNTGKEWEIKDGDNVVLYITPRRVRHNQIDRLKLYTTEYKSDVANKFIDELKANNLLEQKGITLGESKKTEAEDMTQVKDAIEVAVEKSDSTDLEKDQVKGSIDVLKTDEESAIEGYEDFKDETEKVADKELADAVNNQMEEIIDDEKEHIEKLDTIKSALSESKAERTADNMIKNEDKMSNDIYKYKGKEFRYDCDNAIVEYIWTDPDTNECVVIDEIGLSNDNWEDRKLRDAYLDEYIRQLEDEANRLADDFIANEFLGESLNQKINRKLQESRGRFDRAELVAVKDSIDTALDDLQIQSDGTTGAMADKVLVNDLRSVSQSVGNYLNKVQEGKDLKHPELNNSVKAYYADAFGKDELNADIKEVTFLDLYRALKNKQDVYDLIGVRDSVVRERLFAELARILNQPIAYVNNIWQYGVEDGQPNIVKEDKETGTIRQSLNTGVLPIVNVDLYSLYSSGWFDNLVLDDDSNAKFDEIIQDIAPRFIKETLQDILPSVEIYATGVYHPREYNYGGDELEFDLVVNANEYNALKEKALSSDMFETYLKDNYSSRSGFISSMPDDIDEFNNADEWKQMVQVIMFALKDTALTDVNEAYLNDFSEAVNQEFPYVDAEIYNAIEELEYKASKENITLDVDYVTNYIKEQFGNTDSYDYILDKVLSGLNLTESAKVDEAKKEELFNTDVNVNVDAGDIASGNNLDLGGLGEIASAVGLMASEENTKSDKEKLAEDSDDEIPVVNPDEQDYYDNKGYIISLYPRSRSNVSII